jgi:two-component system, NtrC family, sensor histidine kinase HydH
MQHSESRQARFGALAIALAQELRNPLSTITMTLELLREELATRMRAETGAVKRVDAALDELKRLDRVFAEFLRYARDPELELRPSDVNRIVEDALAVVSPELAARRVTPVLQLDRRSAPVLLDDRLFRQALVCLLDNVVGTLQGGTVTVQTRIVPEAFELSVIDTGPGHEPESSDRIFDSFFTLASGRSGVGLALVRQVVELHGGRVRYETAPRSGNRFSVVLPLAGSP